MLNEMQEGERPASWPEVWLDLRGGAHLVVDAGLRVRWASRGCWDVLSAGTPVTQRDGVLAGIDPHVTVQLHDVVRRATPQRLAVGLLLPEGGREPHLVKARLLQGEPERRVGLSVKRAGAPLEPPDLTGLFGMTFSEQQIIGLLLKGSSATEIAETLGITLLTARTHIKRAYSKLDIHSKEQLFARMLHYIV